MALNNTSKVEERESCHAHGIHKKNKMPWKWEQNCQTAKNHTKSRFEL